MGLEELLHAWVTAISFLSLVVATFPFSLNERLSPIMATATGTFSRNKKSFTWTSSWYSEPLDYKFLDISRKRHPQYVFCFGGIHLNPILSYYAEEFPWRYSEEKKHFRGCIFKLCYLKAIEDSKWSTLLWYGFLRLGHLRSILRFYATSLWRLSS